MENGIFIAYAVISVCYMIYYVANDYKYIGKRIIKAASAALVTAVLIVLTSFFLFEVWGWDICSLWTMGAKIGSSLNGVDIWPQEWEGFRLVEPLNIIVAWAVGIFILTMLGYGLGFVVGVGVVIFVCSLVVYLLGSWIIELHNPIWRCIFLFALEAMVAAFYLAFSFRIKK